MTCKKGDDDNYFFTDALTVGAESGYEIDRYGSYQDKLPVCYVSAPAAACFVTSPLPKRRAQTISCQIARLHDLY